MATKFPLFVAFTALDQLTGPTARMSGSLDKFAKRAERAGRTLTIGLTAPIVAFGVKSVATGLDYQRSINAIQARTGATAEEVQKLAAVAESDLGPGGMVATAREAAGAMLELARSGQSVAEIQRSIPGVLNLATAAQLDQAEAAQITATTLDVYGLAAADSARVTDVLAVAANRGEQTLDELGEGLKGAGATARIFHQPFETSVGILNALADAGFEGSAGAMILKGALVNLAGPGAKAGRTLEKLRIKPEQILDGAGGLRDLAGILELLDERGATAAQVIALFGKRAGPGMATLLKGGTGALRAFEGELGASGGAAERLAKIQLSGGVEPLEQFRKSWESLLVTVAKSGLIEALGSVAGQLASLVRWVGTLSPGVLKLGIAVAAVGAALGPLLIGIGGLAHVLSVVVPLAKFLGPVIGAIVSPVGLAALAVGGLITAGVLLVRNWKEIKGGARAAWGYVMDFVGGAVDWISGKLTSLRDALPDWLLDLLGVERGGAAPAPPAPGGAVRARSLGPERANRAIQGAAGAAAAARVSGRVQVDLSNLPRGTRVSAESTGDVPLDVDAGYSMAVSG